MEKETMLFKTTLEILRFRDEEHYKACIERGVDFDPPEKSVSVGNVTLDEGFNTILLLATGGTAVPFSNTYARIGVGDSNTPASKSQTDLLGTNKAYKAMDSGYPSVSGTTVTFRATFGSTEANFAWNEFTIDNGAAAGKNWNRMVSTQGTKSSGQIWTCSLTITRPD